MKDVNNLEAVVVELAGAVEGCLAVETMEDLRPNLKQIEFSVNDAITGIIQTDDKRQVDGMPVREAFEMMKHTVEVCHDAPEIEPVKQTLGEMLRALRQMDRELAV